jgi:riboflavin synthase
VFTGLIQALGKLYYLDNQRLKIICSQPGTALLEELELGDSIAVNGVCLTVEQILAQGFIATASPETLKRSTLGKLADDQAIVNLESSLRVGSKIGGHFVTGHVDGIGYLDTAESTATAWEISFTVPDPPIARYIISKGSIAVNGISLTVADCTPEGHWFKVAVIPVTYAETNLQYLKPGEPVNLEGDILGKYVERFTRLGQGARGKGQGQENSELSEALSLDFLAEHGYR